VAVFEKSQLGNGIRVVTAPMPQVGSVSCFVMLAAGSRYETPDAKGIAHFSEHMFFKGTERRPTARTIATEIDAIGGEFNAFTGKELTGYYVKSGAETRDIAFDVLTDMLLNSRFDAEEIEKEKGVILEEMNVYLDTPQRYVGSIYDRLLYADQPLGWDILGTKETIEAATRETFTSSAPAAASATTCTGAWRSSWAGSSLERRDSRRPSSSHPTARPSTCTRSPRSRLT
jgi:predicted Zn-dependent peptidase